MQQPDTNQKIEDIKNIIAENAKEKRKILTLYLVFFATFFVAIIPISIASVFATMICVCTLSIIYAIRSNAEEDSLAENHMTYLIRTFWRANLYLFIMVFFASVYLTVFADYIPVLPCIKYIEDHLMYFARHADTAQLMHVFTPCMEAFWEHNYKHLIISGLIAFVPTITFLVTRGLRGITLVLQHKLIPDNKL